MAKEIFSNAGAQQFFGQLSSPKLVSTVLCALFLYMTFSMLFLYEVEIYYEIFPRKDLKLRPVTQQERKNECALNFAAEISKKPLIKTDPNKFIFTIQCNGPTNQMIGLRDTVYLAILLNRTVIVPEFLKHKTDSSGKGEPIDARMRLDIEELSSLVSTVPYSKVSSVCQNHFGVAFMGRWGPRFDITDSVLANLNFTLSRKENGEYNKILNSGDKALKNKPTDLREYYTFDSKCALVHCPYRSFSMRERHNAIGQAKKILKSNEGSGKLSIANMHNTVLYSIVYTKVHRPKFLLDITLKFAQEIMHTMDYLAIHWRFDPDDWLIKCKNQKPKVCDQIYSINGSDIVNAGLKQIKDRIGPTKEPVIYFATPLNQKKLILSVREAAKAGKGTKLKVFTSVDLQQHLKAYDVCEELSGNMEDVLASVEMQICVTAKSFMFSKVSSWSSEVLHQREGNELAKYDVDILNAAWNARGDHKDESIST